MNLQGKKFKEDYVNNKDSNEFPDKGATSYISKQQLMRYYL